MWIPLNRIFVNGDLNKSYEGCKWSEGGYLTLENKMNYPRPGHSFKNWKRLFRNLCYSSRSKDLTIYLLGIFYSQWLSYVHSSFCLSICAIILRLPTVTVSWEPMVLNSFGILDIHDKPKLVFCKQSDIHERVESFE